MNGRAGGRAGPAYGSTPARTAGCSTSVDVSVETQATRIRITDLLALQINREMIARLGRPESLEDREHLLELVLESRRHRVLVRDLVADARDGRRAGREGGHQHLVLADALGAHVA